MAKQIEHRQLTRKQQSHAKREAKAERTLTIVAISVVAVIVTLAIIGIVTDVRQTRRPVARVDDEIITAKDYESRQSYERTYYNLQLANTQQTIAKIQGLIDQQASGPQPEGEAATDTSFYDSYLQQYQLQEAQLTNQLSYDYVNILGKQILDTMIEERLIRAEAAVRNLVVTEDELNQAVETYFGFDREAAMTATDPTTDTATSVMTLEEYEQAVDFNNSYLLQPSGFSEDDFRDMIEVNLLREKLTTDLSSGLETTADQVETIVFSVGSEEDGIALQERLNSGEEEATAILEEVNANPENNISGYDMPFLPVNYLESQFSQEIAQITFNTNVGKATPPTLGPGDTYLVLYVVAHEERALSEDIFGSTADQAYQEWLTDAKANRTEYLEWEKAVVTKP